MQTQDLLQVNYISQTNSGDWIFYLAGAVLFIAPIIAVFGLGTLSDTIGALGIIHFASSKFLVRI